MLNIKKFLIVCISLALLAPFTAQAEEMMNIEQIKSDFIFPNFPGIVIIPCLDDPETPDVQQLCSDGEYEIWWKFYALIDAQVLKQIREDYGTGEEAYESGISIKGLISRSYMGGCVRAKFEVRKHWAREEGYDLREIVKKIYVTHHLPFANGCVEGSLSDYGSAGDQMEIAP